MPPLDLNLLTVFDTLYEQRSVTRAAKRLGLTQSAVSHALRRLRDAVGDPLFVRAGRDLQPTARATNMAAAVRAGLGQLHDALAPASFDPASAQRQFTIAAGSYFCGLTVPRLIAAVRAQAPGVAVRIVPVAENLLAMFDERAVDLALGVFDRMPARLISERLFRDELVWIAAAGNDRAHRISTRGEMVDHPRLEVGVPRPFGIPHALAIADGPGSRSITDVLDGQNVVYDALTAATIVGTTDLVALVPRRVAEADGARLGVVVLDIPEPPATIDLFMMWHRQAEGDPGLSWLRTRIAVLETADLG